MAAKEERQNEMFALIESWKSGGQGQQEFCKGKNIPYHIFHYWYKKYRAIYSSSVPESEFISLNLSSSSSSSPLFELIVPSGKRISFYQQVEASFLRSLLE